MSYTKAVAAFARQKKYDKLSQELIDKVKKHLLDTIGCCIHGSGTAWAKIVADYVICQGGRDEASLWLREFKGPANTVALALGVMAHSYELDDYHGGAKLHPGAVIIPAAIPVAEKLGSTGRDLICALIAGYEVMVRSSLAAGPLAARKRGWHLTGICGTLGAAAAVGCLMELDEKRMAHALGLAGTQSAGLFAFNCNGADSKRFHPGRSAQSGVIAAELADKGLTGPDEIYEFLDGGFCSAFSDAPKLEELTRELNNDYVTKGVSIKPYACCASTHSSIDAIRDMVHMHQIGPNDVKEIIVYNHSIVKLQTSWRYEPISPMQAQMNMEYCVAVALAEGNVGPDKFRADKIADSKLVELAHKVRFEIDPEIEKIYPRSFPGRVAIRLNDGSTVEHKVSGPKGSPENPITLKEVEEKFFSLVDPIIGHAKANKIVLQVGNIEQMGDMKSLIEVLSA